MTRYRACLVDDDLEQVTLWVPVDNDGRAAWEDIFSKQPIRVTRFLVHEVALDLIAVRRVDEPMTVRKGDRAAILIGGIRPAGPACCGGTGSQCSQR